MTVCVGQNFLLMHYQLIASVPVEININAAGFYYDLKEDARADSAGSNNCFPVDFRE